MWSNTMTDFFIDVTYLYYDNAQMSGQRPARAMRRRVRLHALGECVSRANGRENGAVYVCMSVPDGRNVGPSRAFVADMVDRAYV